MADTLLLNVQNAAIRFGDKILFENLAFNIREGEKICLVGKNGAGKTTLMNIIMGHRELDDGLRWQLQGSTIGYLQQEIHPKPGQTVEDFVFEGLHNQDGSHDYKIERVLDPLNLNIHDKMESLSGGQLRRTELARALVEEPDILLLDEPTNHLDLDVIEWLEGYLKSYRGAVVCISHDKAFLNNVSNKIFWLDRGKLKCCPRGFSFFDEWATMILEQEERELNNRQKSLDQEVEWASRGVKARRKRNIRRLDLMKSERDKLRADKNALNRMLAKVEFAVGDTGEASSRIAAEFHKVSKRFIDDGKEKIIFDKFNLRIQRGDRIGIVGKNGSGKTSFLKLLVKELRPDEGTVKLAKDIAYSYFDQKRKDLNPEYSLHRVLCPNGSDYIDVLGKTRHVCGYLKDFLFDPKMVYQPVSTLSGGQKNRLMLARVLANPGALLILDEPTNDLDMDTLDKLEDFLMSYTGTLLVVSHDRDFLDQTVSKILAFDGDGKVEAIIGGYQDYLARHRGKEIPPDKNTSKKTSKIKIATKIKAQQKLSYALQFELDNLPAKIAALEEEIATIEPKLADHDLYSRDAEYFHRLSMRLKKAKTELETAEHRWLELEEMKAAIVG
ncbi:MAG: ATP-binding cassette domain-containing protein [Alphaproteobacteria bacterium]|nr:ATP-binding cassette domain-containing protein [Alphaproteobacteria bacterium]